MKRIFDIVVSILTWSILSVSLVYLLCIWNTIPDIIGVHFASDGAFDVFDSKYYIAYPYAAGFGFLFLLEIASVSVRKARSGMKLSEAGERRLKLSLSFLLNALKLYVSVFFSYWAHCVMAQVPENHQFTRIISWAVIIIFLLFVVSAVVIRTRNPQHPV